MVTIRTVTWIDAPVERCFKLATSVDFQLAASKNKNVKIMTGPKSGFLEQGGTITWQGPMFGLGRIHTNRVEVFRPFSYLLEKMVSGGFKVYEHERHFAAMDDGTRMKDEVRFTVGWGLFGRLIDKPMLKHRVAALIKWQNEALKETAESDLWGRFLESSPEVVATAFQGGGKKLGPQVETKSHFFAH